MGVNYSSYRSFNSESELTRSGGSSDRSWPKIADGDTVVFGRLRLIDLIMTSKSVARISRRRLTAAWHSPGQSA